MMTEVGDISLSDDEAERLREYFAKGGFLWADDFWGVLRMGLVGGADPQGVPGRRVSDHRRAAEPPALPVAVRNEEWGAADFSDRPLAGGRLSERGEDSKDVHVRAIVDSHDRVMVLITHNTDFGDSYEREGDNPEYFYQMSVPGYAFGINTILYAMTH